MRHHLVRRAGALVLACVVVLTACGDDDDQTLDATSTTSTTLADDTEPVDEGAGGTAPETTETTGTTVADGTVIEVGVIGGDVTGGGRHRVDVGQTVTIRVTSDVADHVHLHGYDVLADVGAGETAELTFDATIPGVFEVELEDARIPLLDLEIS